MTVSNLVEHAERELKLINEDPEVCKMYIKMIKTFSKFGHSGASAAICADTLHDLLRFKNLAPLTDDPAEWLHHKSEVRGGPPGGGIWQNKRNSEAFSEDGGKTYYFVARKNKILETAHV
jgi:hypothetical protein